jgi:hypothetical protein
VTSRPLSPDSATEYIANGEPERLTLDLATLDALAEELLARVEARVGLVLVEAEAVARFLDVERAWVYEHADELGARRLGVGPKARLRFNLVEVDERLSACRGDRESAGGKAAQQAAPRRRRRGGMGTSASLLPIRGRESARG